MNIRNFCIIAHIDHGKSTLADRFLEYTKTVAAREMQTQLLDQMDLERERGITIKLQPVRMDYAAANGDQYQLNLIDTPGHVDFQYEVSRSLAACEGAVLLVDASQGIQAQTLANLYLALDQELEIIPVVNKIDLPGAKPEDVIREICSVLGCDESGVLRVSGKTGEGVPELLEHIVAKVPPPIEGDAHLRALIFDSLYDSYQGVVAYVRVVDGSLQKGDKLKMVSSGEQFEVLEVGVFRPGRQPIDRLSAGEVGYIVTGQKEISDAQVGDTVASAAFEGSPLPGYRPAVPMVFASFYPVEAQDYDLLRTSLEKLALNDAALQYVPEQSQSLGRGFRVGFLGMLHMEIVHARLLREYDLDIVVTIPSVVYRITMKQSGESVEISNPSETPDAGRIEYIEEPFAKMEIVTPSMYVGSVMSLAETYRGEYQTTEYLDQDRAVLHYAVPLASIVSDFYDALKGVSSGYASLSYELSGYRQSDIVKMDILVTGDPVEAFARMVPRSETLAEGKRMVKKLKELLPKQQFEIPIQAAIGGKIVARETVRAFRKDVTADLYGGDVTRKRKLLEKQKKGKKRMKHVGNVAIPQDVFIEMMKK